MVTLHCWGCCVGELCVGSRHTGFYGSVVSSVKRIVHWSCCVPSAVA